MGMRATISYVEESGKTFVTTSQWSTRLDQTLGHFAHSEQESGVSAEDAVMGLLQKVTSNHGHVSALDISLPDDADKSPGTTYRSNDIPVGNNVVIAAPQEKPYTYASEQAAWVAIDDHLDGGSVGAIYRESNPGVIEFFWASRETDNIIKDERVLSDLADFYSDVFGNPQELLEMDFRN